MKFPIQIYRDYDKNTYERKECLWKTTNISWKVRGFFFVAQFRKWEKDGKMQSVLTERKVLLAKQFSSNLSTVASCEQRSMPILNRVVHWWGHCWIAELLNVNKRHLFWNDSLFFLMFFWLPLFGPFLPSSKEDQGGGLLASSEVLSVPASMPWCEDDHFFSGLIRVDITPLEIWVFPKIGVPPNHPF